MPGVYCPRCETNVRFLEQDGKSCPNCGRVLVEPTTTPEERRPKSHRIITTPDPKAAA